MTDWQKDEDYANWGKYGTVDPAKKKYVWNLSPGDVVNGHTFVQRAPHPLYPTLQLVVWRMADGSWSHDALHELQYVGEAEPATADARHRRLRSALLRPEQAS